MPNLNKVMLIGNLTRDPVMRVTPSGMQICEFGLAMNRVYRTQQGETREETCFMDVSCFGKQAETCNRYLRKGDPAYVEGRLKLDRWEDKRTGEKRQSLSVVMERMQLLRSAPPSASNGAQVQAPGVDRPSAPMAVPRSMPPFSGGEQLAPPQEIVADDFSDEPPF
jgi:single-strand DNA-binding protein